MLFYAGMVGLVVAWLALARGVASDRGPTRGLALIAATWSVPLLLAPPLFSHDLYSYLAQGTIAHLGLESLPIAAHRVLAHLGHPGVLHAVSPFWRRTTAPYGPLFIALVREVVTMTGSNLVLGRGSRPPGQTSSGLSCSLSSYRDWPPMLAPRPRARAGWSC